MISRLQATLSFYSKKDGRSSGKKMKNNSYPSGLCNPRALPYKFDYTMAIIAIVLDFFISILTL